MRLGRLLKSNKGWRALRIYADQPIRRFQPVGGLLRDCEIFAKLLCKPLSDRRQTNLTFRKIKFHIHQYSLKLCSLQSLGNVQLIILSHISTSDSGLILGILTIYYRHFICASIFHTTTTIAVTNSELLSNEGNK